MQTVTLENGDVLKFPDDMSPDVMEALVKQHVNKGNPSTLADVSKSIAGAPAKAVVGLAGFPGDVRDLVGAGKKYVSQFLPDWVNSADAVVNKLDPFNRFVGVLPTSQDLRGAAEKVTGPWYDPQTKAGRVADTATQVATTMGRSLLKNPKQAASIITGTTAGTEVAGAMTEENPWARAAGGLFGGGIPALFSAIKSRPGAVVRQNIGELTQPEIDAAIARQDLARQQGVPLMGTESLDKGHGLASAVAASPTGQQIIADFVKERPAQVSKAVRGGLLAQTGPLDTPQANASRAQQAAEGVISGLESDRSALVAPDYFMANRQQLPQSTVDAVRARLQAAQAASPASQQPDFAPYIRDLTAPNSANVGVLDEIYKRARTAADLPIGASTADKQSAYAARVARPMLEAVTQQNPYLARGRQLYGDFTRNEIEPMTSGPVGVIAGKSGVNPAEPSPVGRVISTIADENTARPSTIRELYTNLNKQDRQAFPGMVQTYIENHLNDALADIRSGANPTAGAKFRQAIAGTPQGQANFDEMMRGVAKAHGLPPDEVVRGAKSLLETLELTGRTPGMGSPTQPRQEIAKEMSKSIVGDTLGTISLTPTRPLVHRWIDWMQRARYEDLARALTAPDSVQQLVQMAKYKPSGITAKFVAASLLGFDHAISDAQ